MTYTTFNSHLPHVAAGSHTRQRGITNHPSDFGLSSSDASVRRIPRQVLIDYNTFIWTVCQHPCTPSPVIVSRALHGNKTATMSGFQVNVYAYAGYDNEADMAANSLATTRARHPATKTTKITCRRSPLRPRFVALIFSFRTFRLRNIFLPCVIAIRRSKTCARNYVRGRNCFPKSSWTLSTATTRISST